MDGPGQRISPHREHERSIVYLPVLRCRCCGGHRFPLCYVQAGLSATPGGPEPVPMTSGPEIAVPFRALFAFSDGDRKRMGRWCDLVLEPAAAPPRCGRFENQIAPPAHPFPITI